MQICDTSIVTFGIRGFCLGFSNTYYVDSSDRCIQSVVDKIKIDICILKIENHSKENNMKIQYLNESHQNLDISDPTK